MTKKILVTLAFGLTVVGVAVSYKLLGSIVAFIAMNPIWLAILGGAIAVQLVGHVLRAKRTKLLIDQAAPSSLTFQFAALSTGYLFNALLPLRIGEIIRAFLVARRLRISLLYTFSAVVIERAIDIVFIGLVVVAGAVLIGGPAAPALALVALVLSGAAAAVLVGFWLLKREDKRLLAIVSVISGLFNDRLSNNIRFKVWSLIFGLQNFFNKRDLVYKYAAFAVGSWACYFVSTAIIVVPLLGGGRVFDAAIASVSPYVISAPSISPLDASSYYSLGAQLPVPVHGLDLVRYSSLIWAVLVLPMALLGIVALSLYRISPSSRRDPHPATYENKLLRFEDISQNFPVFLETYFQGHALSRVLHTIELKGGLSLVKFFKGGSDAITVLALKNGILFVKKIVPIEYADRLRTQYVWLRKYRQKRTIVNVTGEQRTDDYYAIDLEYDPMNISLFEYVHTRSLADSKKALSDTWSYMFRHVYELKDESIDQDRRDEYIEDRLLSKIRKVSVISEDIRRAIEPKQIMINGKKYDNFNQIIAKIKKNRSSWTDLATYRKSAVTHGDLTIDNILVNTKTMRPVIIDPSDDNQIKGPVIDLARHTQSLLAGYEFLNNNEEPVKATQEKGMFTINFSDHRSARYNDLYRYFNEELSPELFTETERRCALFHTGLLYGRMLVHRVVINPHNCLKYYAVCVRLLNEFYAQYKES